MFSLLSRQTDEFLRKLLTNLEYVCDNVSAIVTFNETDRNNDTQIKLASLLNKADHYIPVRQLRKSLLL